MMVPGSNILRTALSVIGSQIVQYHRFQSRQTTITGTLVPVYAPAATLNGSFQPVPRSLYSLYGLDLQKNYSTFYTTNDLLDIQRDVAADQITFCGKVFQVLSANDWYNIDGWKGVLCVQIEGQNVG